MGRVDSLARDASPFLVAVRCGLPLTEATLRSESTLDGFEFYLAELFLQGAAAHGGLRVNPSGRGLPPRPTRLRNGRGRRDLSPMSVVGAAVVWGIAVGAALLVGAVAAAGLRLPSGVRR